MVLIIILQYLDEFSVEEGGNLCCFGKIRTKDEYLLNVQNLIIENDIKNKDFEIVLNAKDIYKDLRILGYDYGSKFRKLVSVKTNDFKIIHGEVEWDGNWITFMDAILQSMITALAFRKMMVPVMIRSMICDPKVLFEAIDANRVYEEEESPDFEKRIDEFERGEVTKEQVKYEATDMSEATEKDLEQEWKDVANEEKVEDILENIYRDEYRIFRAVLPFYVDLNSRLIVTHGIEIEDILAVPIPRKFNIPDLKVESYEFVANEDLIAVEECDKKEILEYIKV